MNDVISRQAAIDALRAMQTYKLLEGDDMLLIDQAGAMTEMMLLPSAQPKSGKWISDDKIFGGVPYHCSECGEKMHINGDGQTIMELLPQLWSRYERSVTE